MHPDGVGLADLEAVVHPVAVRIKERGIGGLEIGLARVRLMDDLVVLVAVEDAVLVEVTVVVGVLVPGVQTHLLHVGQRVVVRIIVPHVDKAVAVGVVDVVLDTVAVPDPVAVTVDVHGVEGAVAVVVVGRVFDHALGTAITVRVGVRGVRPEADKLVAVSESIAVGVAPVRVALLAEFDVVAETVAVRVEVVRIGRIQRVVDPARTVR